MVEITEIGEGGSSLTNDNSTVITIEESQPAIPNIQGHQERSPCRCPVQEK